MLLDLTERILTARSTKGYKEVKSVLDRIDYTEVISEVLELFGDLFDRDHLKSTYSSTEFYTANPLFDEAIKAYRKDHAVLKSDLFYSMKSGIYIPHVPSELVATINYAKSKYNTPNKMLLAIDNLRISKFLNMRLSTDDSITVKSVIDTIFGYSVDLLTRTNLLASNRDFVEVYISNINNVLIAPTELKERIADMEDLLNIEYNEDVGVIIKGYTHPIRGMIGMYGITEDDLDLRKVI